MRGAHVCELMHGAVMLTRKVTQRDVPCDARAIVPVMAAPHAVEILSSHTDSSIAQFSSAVPNVTPLLVDRLCCKT
jgi:hypothetical protein